MEENQVEGRNSVIELLKSGKDINRLYIQKGEKHGSILEIIKLAKKNKVIISEVEKSKLDKMANMQNHQGVIAIVPPFEYSDVEDILEEAKKRNEDPFILILDQIEDVHNLGSIIRTAECSGVHGIIIPKRRAAQVNSTVNKTSAGAVQYMKIARVNNINETINYLKENIKPNDIVLDNFAGSGSTLIAAERVQRRARLIEIDPHYCDIIIHRFETLTGKKAEFIGNIGE